jgi:hypothetical protein
MKLSLVCFVSFGISKSRSNPYPGPYPEVGRTTFSFDDCSYKFESYIDSGASTRVFGASKLSCKDSGYPSEVAVKCLYSTNRNLQSKPDLEFRILRELSKNPELSVPRAYYLSEQWVCGGSHRCQYIAMTKAGPDFDRIIKRNTLGLAKSSKASKVGQFELFVASVGLSVVSELQKLHRAGAVHGDIGRYNVANSLEDPRQVVLIDFGQGKLKRDISESQFKHGVERDFRRTQAFILRLIKTKMGIDHNSSSEKSFRENKLFSLVASLNSPSSELNGTLTNFLKSEFGRSFSGKILY